MANERLTPADQSPLPPSRRVFGNAPGCPNCCFLKAASGWSRQPSGSLTAGTVAGRGASLPPSSSPPAQSPPASPSSSSGGGTSGGGGQQCTILQNNNLAAPVLATTSAGSADACCALCQQKAGCNVFVYCPQAAG